MSVGISYTDEISPVISEIRQVIDDFDTRVAEIFREVRLRFSELGDVEIVAYGKLDYEIPSTVSGQAVRFSKNYDM